MFSARIHYKNGEQELATGKKQTCTGFYWLFH